MRNRILCLAALVVAMVTVSVGTASAYCGPEFTNKSQAIAYYHTPEGKVILPALIRKLRAHGFLHGDQDVWAFFNSPNVVTETTPKGYTLDTNTSCNGSQIVPFAGLLVHSQRLVLAVRGHRSTKKIGAKKLVKTTPKVVKTEEKEVSQPDGSKKVFNVETIQVTTTYHQKIQVCYTYTVFEKAYCRNFVTGKTFKKCSIKTETTTSMKEEVKETYLRTIPAPTPPPLAVTPPPPAVTPPPVVPPVEVSRNCNTIAPGAYWDSSVNACVINICGNVTIINGNNNTVINEGNCNKEKEPEAKCEPGEVGTPPHCHKPECPAGEVGTPPNCHPPTCKELGNCPTPRPSASASLTCPPAGDGEVDVVLSNGSDATASATFTVNGTVYGPIAAGGTKTVTVPVAEDTDVHVKVMSNGSTLLDQIFHRNCEQPPPPPVSVQVTLMGLPAHVLVEENLYGYIEASVSNGDSPSVKVEETPESRKYGHISGLETWSERYDGTPCPEGVHCYRFHIWGEFAEEVNGQVLSKIVIVATASADGKEAKAEGVVPVKNPNSGTF